MTDSRARPRVAYLLNSYPSPTQTFVRREIQALELLGLPIRRHAVRRWQGPLPDPADVEESARTDYLLDSNPVALLVSALRNVVRTPRGFLQALRLTVSLGRRSRTGVLLHLVYLVEACHLRLRLEREEIEHVHSHFGTNATTVAMLCGVLGGPPYSFTAHGPEEWDDPHGLGIHEKAQRAAFVVAISSFARSQLYRWVDFDCWDRIRVIRCGLDEAYFSGAPTEQKARSGLLCVGRLAEQKGQGLLLQALADLVSRGRTLHLTLVGDGPQRPQLEEYARQLGLADQVAFTGWLPGYEIQERMRTAQALVLPSFAEGLPVVIMEAMALGTPVVTTRIAGIPELVQDGVTGWLVTAGDVEELVTAVERAVDSTEPALQELRTRAYRIVEQHHRASTEARSLKGMMLQGARAQAR